MVPLPSHIDEERENLRVHVDLCTQRYADVIRRLERIERFIIIAVAVSLVSGGQAVASYIPALQRIMGG